MSFPFGAGLLQSTDNHKSSNELPHGQASMIRISKFNFMTLVDKALPWDINDNEFKYIFFW